MYTIFCLVGGEATPFPVDIDGDITVGHLKDLIKTKKPMTLAKVEPDHLNLYYVNLEFDESDKQEHITHANEVLQGLTKHKPLHPWRRLSEIEEGFPNGVLHILVQLPPSESIHSRPVVPLVPPALLVTSYTDASHLDQRECLRVSDTYPEGESFCPRPGHDIADDSLHCTLQRLPDHPLPPRLSLGDHLSLLPITPYRPTSTSTPSYPSWSNDSLLVTSYADVSLPSNDLPIIQYAFPNAPLQLNHQEE